MILNWSWQFHRALLDARTRDEIWAAKCEADTATGVRSFAVEVLFTVFAGNNHRTDDWLLHVANIIARAGMDCAHREKVAEALRNLSNEIDGLDTCLTWCICRSNEKFNYYKWLADRPGVTLIRPTDFGSSPRVDVKLLLEECRSTGQVRAIRRLANIAMAIGHYGDSTAGVKLKRAAWILGPSGSGKSWTGAQFGRLVGLPLYSATVGAWRMRTNRGESSTIIEILKAAESGPLVILIDEIDKIHLNEGDNSNYFRAVLDEVMLLSTHSLHDWQASPVALSNLKNSWFLYAGAFQELYKKKLGGQAMFAEQIEDLTLTHDDIAESGWLPDELLNRMGWMIEVPAPSVDELCEAMAVVENSCGLTIPENERSTYAKECVVGMGCRTKIFV